MNIELLNIPGLLLIKPQRYFDDRGFFSETYHKDALREFGVDQEFVQDNHSCSIRAGTVRGLHYQSPPYAQAKLVRVARGRILDVAVDARVGSPSFGRHVAVELDAETGRQLLVPSGFLHGFLTLEPDTHVTYKVDNYYLRECDGAVRFDDPDLGIDWGGFGQSAVLSEKDANASNWADFSSPFVYRDV
jgi:dTDP-4-dehydrorhamnose 3,5-epimerase